LQLAFRLGGSLAFNLSGPFDLSGFGPEPSTATPSYQLALHTASTTSPSVLDLSCFNAQSIPAYPIRSEAELPEALSLAPLQLDSKLADQSPEVNLEIDPGEDPLVASSPQSISDWEESVRLIVPVNPAVTDPEEQKAKVNNLLA
jgi:hypothetical protein